MREAAARAANIVSERDRLRVVQIGPARFCDERFESEAAAER